MQRTIGARQKPPRIWVLYQFIRDSDVPAHLKQSPQGILRDDVEREKLSPAERERSAANFFDTTSPWTLAEIPGRRRFGIPNFVVDINQLLVRSTRKISQILREV
ncbi:hypothetical protein BD779DRAFT_798310 [Infundibulicybe gibba]|nr:hypothetical protein BD779DRAFT_798310 [Infundibulicybe gibba]